MAFKSAEAGTVTATEVPFIVPTVLPAIAGNEKLISSFLSLNKQLEN